MKTQAAPYNVARIQPAKKSIDQLKRERYDSYYSYTILFYSSSYIMSICNYVL